MKQAGWIVALILAAALLWPDEPTPEWQWKHDLLVDSLNRVIHAQDTTIENAGHRNDSLQAILDSARMSFPPPPVVIERELRRMRFAPLQQAVDSLNAE